MPGFTSKEKMVDGDYNDYVMNFQNKQLTDEDYFWFMDFWKRGQSNKHIRDGVLTNNIDISDIRRRHQSGEINDYEAHHELGLLTGVIV